MTATRSRRPPQNRPATAATAPSVPAPDETACIALDPALGHMGAVALNGRGILTEWVCWRPKGALGARLTALQTELTAWIIRLQPAWVVWENGRGRWPSPQLDVVEAALHGWCADAGVPRSRHQIYVPATWRAEVLGRGCGHLGKDTVLQLLRMRFAGELAAIPDSEPDCMEAWGVAQCWWERIGAPAARRLHDAGITDPAILAALGDDAGAAVRLNPVINSTSYRRG